MILAADNNGGRYNKVHRQTDDGLVISVAMGDNLTPLVFCYKNAYGCKEEALLSASFFPHKRLMRGDCGWQEFEEKQDILFSWKQFERVTDGFTAGPSNEYGEAYHDELNCANDVSLGFGGGRKVFYRKDREYWTPNKTLQATTPEQLFGFTQWNPNSCPPKKPNKCGIVTLEDKEC